MTDYRQTEINILRHIVRYDAVKYLIGMMAPFLVSVTSFVTFAVMDSDNRLTVDIVFVSIALFHILRYPLAILPTLVTNWVATETSVQRINEYLALEEYMREENGTTIGMYVYIRH
jgi:ABC-type multidrug transport system fused ATPase/permease subunit